MPYLPASLQTRRAIAVLLGLVALLALTPARAQVVPSAYRNTRSLWAGAEYSNIRASFPYQSSQRLTGFSIFADFKFNGRIALEGDARFLHNGGFAGSTETSYLAGPKIYLFPIGKFAPYGKFLVGNGRIHYPYNIGEGSYLALAPGGGADYRLTRHLHLRAEYEYQLWHNSPGFPNEPNHQLTPNGFHIGAAYRILPW
jgi:opacity protein-like surface antigen